MRQGYIYKITNNINDKIYIGQTARDIDTRFREHCSETRGHSRLHEAIQKYGWRNFQVELVETVPLDQLDAREIFWINYYKATERDKGYNITIGGKNGSCPRDYAQIRVVENSVIFDSKEECARIIHETTSWSLYFIKDMLTKVMDTDLTFCDYHFQTCFVPIEEVSDYDVQVDWVKSLNIRFEGTKIYCEELNKEFSTIGEAARYCIDNNLTNIGGEYRINSAITAIGKFLKNPTEEGVVRCNGLHFYKLPGTTKQPGSLTPFHTTKVYCPQINKRFNSYMECAKYFLDNKIWTNIKMKTARCRISDVANGVFPHYKGYTFIKE